MDVLRLSCNKDVPRVQILVTHTRLRQARDESGHASQGLTTCFLGRTSL